VVDLADRFGRLDQGARRVEADRCGCHRPEAPSGFQAAATKLSGRSR
jgi:hypothetical protein